MWCAFGTISIVGFADTLLIHYSSLLLTSNMVGIVQLAEHRIVVPGVVGSSPITHPMKKVTFVY